MKKVLIVDDDRDLLEMYAIAFKNANFDVTKIMKLSEVPETVEHNKFDMILLDLMFPEGNALTTIQKIRYDNSTNSKTPIIALTNLDSGEISKKAIEYGANECLFKASQTPKTIFEAAIKLSM